MAFWNLFCLIHVYRLIESCLVILQLGLIILGLKLWQQHSGDILSGRNVPKASETSWHWTIHHSGGCFTYVSQGLQNILSKFVYYRIHTSSENFKLKLCMCTQSHALGTHTKFQLEILTINIISGIVYFREIILESSWNVCETTPSCCCRNSLPTIIIPSYV